MKDTQPARDDELTTLALIRQRRLADAAIAVGAVALLLLFVVAFVTQPRQRDIEALSSTGLRVQGEVTDVGVVGVLGFGFRYVEVAYLSDNKLSTARVWVDGSTGRYTKGTDVTLLTSRDHGLVTLPGELNEPPILGVVVSFASSSCALALVAASVIRFRHRKLVKHLAQHPWVTRQFKMVGTPRDPSLRIVHDGEVRTFALGRSSTPDGRGELTSLIGGEGGRLRTAGDLTGPFVIQLPGSTSLTWAHPQEDP